MEMLLILIGEMALSALRAQRVGGKPVAIADSLVRIVSAGMAAYKEATGQPLDVSKIQPFEEIPEEKNG